MMELLPQIFIRGCRNTMSNVIRMSLFIVISKCFFLLFILRWFRLYCKVSGLSLAWNVPHSAFHCFYSCSLLEQVASKGECKGE